MNNRSLFIATLLLLALFNISFPNCAWAWQSFSNKKYALLVAVNRYEDDFLNHPELKYPEADAVALKEELSKSGYVVEMLIGKDATRASIRAKLAELNAKGNAEGAVILGFFGHGVEYESSKEAMYIPYDSVRRLAKDASGKQLFADDGSNMKLTEPDPETLVGMSEMLDAMRLCKAGNKLLLADCCRKNPNAARGTRAFGSSVKLSDLPNNSAAIFACSVGEEAQEDDAWKHGAMTKCFLELMPEMSKESADVGAIAGKLRRKVAALVATSSNGGKRQTVHPIVNGVVELQLLASTPKSSKMEVTKVGDLREDNMLGMKLVWIPPGKFTMGSAEAEKDRDKDESQVSVTLTSGYWLGETEVTQGQWKRLFATAPWEGKEDVKEGNNYPASYVSWDDCQEFLKELNHRESSQLPPGWKYELPTEAQWEYACRAGSETPYGFGEDESHMIDCAWYDENTWEVGEKYAHEVGKKWSNGFGLYDMHGNVWELCRDSYDEKLPGGADPFVDGEDSRRVSRGGGWGSAAMYLRSARRSRTLRGDRDKYRGFRVALVQTGK